jgi:hypothetical protein
MAHQQAGVAPQGDATRIGLWVAIVVVSALFGFAAGYAMSARTGVEPGYFEAPEAGGYGVAPSGPKMSDELRKHYEGLAK